jgi:hypothetical protein
MKVSKGGMTGDFIMEMDRADFADAHEAAAELERQIAEAAKR